MEGHTCDHDHAYVRVRDTVGHERPGHDGRIDRKSSEVRTRLEDTVQHKGRELQEGPIALDGQEGDGGSEEVKYTVEYRLLDVLLF